jgi:probable phosphoglycerate mutase
VERAILVRHGESEFSARGLLNGDPTVPCALTAAGREQARTLGRTLAREPLDLCIVSEFERVVETARTALDRDELDTIVVPELNDPRYGCFEGEPIDGYRAWAAAASSSDPAPGGGESRRDILARYARAFGLVLARPEERILVVAHSLPIAVVLAAVAGLAPRPRAELVPYAEPYPLDAGALAAALALLGGWLAAPDW